MPRHHHGLARVAAADAEQLLPQQPSEAGGDDGAAEDAEIVAGSIQKVDPAAMPYYDLLTGGFPCQPFTGTPWASGEASGSDGHQESRPRGFRDPRGQLFWHMIALIRANKSDPQRQPRARLLPEAVAPRQLSAACKRSHQRTGQRLPRSPRGP